MNNIELKTLDFFKKRGYSYLRNGYPDFIFFKKDKNKFKNVIFVEVKSNKGNWCKRRKYL